MSDEPLPEEIEPTPPRLVATPDAPHPQVEILSVDAASGVATFQWLNGNGVPVSSGVSIARFTPAEDVTDAELASAITTPAPEPQPVRTISKLVLKQRLDALNKWVDFKHLLEGSGLWDDFIIAQDLRTDHPLFTQYQATFLSSLDISPEQFNTLTA